MPTKRETPTTLELRCSANLQLAADDGTGKKLPSFAMVAYTGAVVKVGMWFDPIIIDLAGVQLPPTIAIRRNHDPNRTIGHSTAVAVRDGQIVLEGVLSFDTEAAREVIAAAKNGFPWQASVGMDTHLVEFIDAGQVAVVNGQQIEGPVDIIRQSTLRETSFVDLGADDGTSASVAASRKENVHMSGKAVQKDAPVEAGKSDTPAAPVAPAPAPEAFSDPGSTVLDTRKQHAAELRRIAAIQQVTKNHAEIAAKAIEEGWTAERAELEVLRASRPTAPAAHTRGAPTIDSTVIEAAICMAGGLKSAEKAFKPEVLQAAHTAFRGRIGLQEVLALGAEANGWNGRSVKSNLREVIMAGFPSVQAGFSTLSLPGIFANTANKFLLAGFMAIEQTWRDISSTRNVSDFKQITSYRLSGGFEYEELAPDGEIKHGTVSEASFTNQAKTYAKMFSITRQDIINDDLGALTAIPSRLGRGAAIKLNKVFWTAFMDNSTFFSSGNANYFEGAATNLQLSSLETALALFRNQTDPDGNPVAIEPASLLTPPSLEVTGANIFNSTEQRDTNSSKTYMTKNPFQGRFRPLVSVYLSNSTIPGNSTTAWYLLADPAVLSTIEVVFLNGVQEPTVETAEADFNVLGIQMRGYHDFGVAKQEHRAGVKSKGAA